MEICNSGQIQTTTRNGKEYYRIRLNIVDTTAKDAKERYSKRYISTDLTVGRKNKYLADALLAKAILEYSPIGSNTPFWKYCQGWQEEKEKEHEIRTITKEGYSYKVGRIIDYFKTVSPDLKLSEVTLKDLNDFKEFLYTVKKSSTAQKNEVGLSSRTVRDILVLVKQIFKYAIDNGHLVGGNPCSALKLPKKVKKSDELPFIGIEDIPTFKEELAVYCSDHPFLIDCFLIGLFYGLRREELCGLKWSAIRNGALHIEHTIVKLKSTVALDATKSEASHRSIAIVPQTQAIFDRLKARQQENRELFGNTYIDTDYIFTFPDGHPMSPDFVSKRFKKLVTRSEKLDSNLHLHDLRVSCVSILVECGMDLKSIQKWVGHSDIRTTMEIYARTKKDKQILVAQKLANAMFA